jgi:hypothetical protein
MKLPALSPALYRTAPNAARPLLATAKPAGMPHDLLGLLRRCLRILLALLGHDQQ